MPQLNRPRALLAAVSATVLLSACQTVGPNFERPGSPKEAAAAGYVMAGDLTDARVRLDDTAAHASGAWWEAFGSPELNETMRLALANSPTVAQANATLERAQAEAAAVRGEGELRLDANGSVQRERINTQSFGFTGFPSPTISLYSVGGTVSYDLDLFGKQKRANEAAQARVEAAAREADAAYLTLTGNVAVQAMKVAGLRAHIAAIERILADDQRLIDIVRRGQQAGGEASSANTDAQAQFLEDTALLPPLKRQLAEARHELALLAGKSPSEWTAPDFDLAKLTVPKDLPITLPATLVRNRPDILAAEAELHAATAEIGVAVANKYPDFRLSANLTQAAIHPEDLLQFSSTGYNLLGGVTAPILNGGTLKARQAAAEAQARVAVARYQETVLRAFTQVSDALANLGVDQQSLATTSLAVQVAEANIRDAESAYRLGSGNLLQVVDAQRQMSRVRRALVQAEAQRFISTVALYAATAADWRTAS